MCCSDWVRHRVGEVSDRVRSPESGSIFRRLRDWLELASGFVREEDSAIGKSTAERAKMRGIGKEERNSKYIKIKSLNRDADSNQSRETTINTVPGDSRERNGNRCRWC